MTRRAASRRARVHGFTLMEVMVAISIFALIGVASYRVLSAVAQTDERLALRVERLRSINRAFWLLQQDIEQLLPRDVRGADGAQPTRRNYLLVQNDAELPLQLTRGGRANPLGLPRSSMQRVAYRVGPHPDYEKTDSPHYHEEHSSYLLRYTWPMLDGSGAEEQAVVQVVLAGIERMSVGIVTAHGVEVEWPSEQEDPPQALQLELTLPEGDSIKRAYKLW